MPTEQQFPGNSKTTRPKIEEPKPVEDKKIERIVEGTVTLRKKPIHKRLLQTFVGTDDAGSVGSYILKDVIVPRVQELFVDAVSDAVEQIIFGDRAGRRRDRRGSSFNSPPGPLVNYNSPSRSNNLRQADPRPELSRRARETHDFGEIVLNNRGEADGVLQMMADTLAEFDVVTVADLYSMLGVTSGFTDTKYGWSGRDALAGARAVRHRGQYLLELPPTSVID
jgi:hypothetical protein